MRADLQATLKGILAKPDLVQALDGVIIETTGLADPGPVVRHLVTSRSWCGARHSLGTRGVAPLSVFLSVRERASQLRLIYADGRYSE